MSQKYKVFINNKAKDITDNWEEFCSQFTLIKAAGGLVYNQENKLLMIFRNGKWDLPKGKVEKDTLNKDKFLKAADDFNKELKKKFADLFDKNPNFKKEFVFEAMTGTVKFGGNEGTVTRT